MEHQPTSSLSTQPSRSTAASWSDGSGGPPGGPRPQPAAMLVLRRRPRPDPREGVRALARHDRPQLAAQLHCSDGHDLLGLGAPQHRTPSGRVYRRGSGPGLPNVCSMAMTASPANAFPAPAAPRGSAARTSARRGAATRHEWAVALRYHGLDRRGEVGEDALRPLDVVVGGAPAGLQVARHHRQPGPGPRRSPGPPSSLRSSGPGYHAPAVQLQVGISITNAPSVTRSPSE